MPQLLSRMDDGNWLTPSVADILEQGAGGAAGDGSIREQTQILTKDLTDFEAPARITNVFPTSSHTLFQVKPGQAAGRKVTGNDVRRSLQKIAERHKDWVLGFLPELQDNDTVGILLRTEAHQAISLRRLLVRPNFRDLDSLLALSLGLTLEDRLIARDLAAIGHLLVVGGKQAKQHFMRATLATLLMLNTPSELRVAFVGQTVDEYAAFVNVPHTLGRMLYNTDESIRLFEGLHKELQRRQQWLQENSVTTIGEYNAKLQGKGSLPTPRIVVVIDALSDADWAANEARIQTALTPLLKDGQRLGIHIIAVSETVPNFLAAVPRLVMRAAANDVIEKLKDFPRPTLRFVDGFVVEAETITPVELCSISEGEVGKLVDYWRNAAIQRAKPADDSGIAVAPPISGRTGVTGILGSEEARRAANERDAQAAQAAQAAPSDANLLKRAATLAAYLGWLNASVVRDVLAVSEVEAATLVKTLQTSGILEKGDNIPMPRFLRLGDNPFK
jgi:hypothetical protein